MFFGSQHVGGATEVMEAEKTGVLVSLLVTLAKSRPVPFPPSPEAAMVRVISRMTRRLCSIYWLHAE